MPNNIDYEVLIKRIKERNFCTSNGFSNFITENFKNRTLKDRFKIISMLCSLDDTVKEIYDNGTKSAPLTNEEITKRTDNLISQWSS